MTSALLCASLRENSEAAQETSNDVAQRIIDFLDESHKTREIASSLDCLGPHLAHTCIARKLRE